MGLLIQGNRLVLTAAFLRIDYQQNKHKKDYLKMDTG